MGKGRGVGEIHRWMGVGMTGCSVLYCDNTNSIKLPIGNGTTDTVSNDTRCPVECHYTRVRDLIRRHIALELPLRSYTRHCDSKV